MTDDELSVEQTGEIRRRLGTLERDLPNVERNMDSNAWKKIKILAGANLAWMMESEERTLDSLNDPNPNLRRAAIGLALNHWELTASVADRCEHIAETDADVDVRIAAVGALANFYHGTKNLRVAHLLASIVRDSTQHMNLRVVAYFSLVMLQGGGLSQHLPEKLTFGLESVDWSLVEKYYKG
jgi:hypothetical protein